MSFHGSLQRRLDRDQLVKNFGQEFQIERVGAIGFGFGRTVVYFQEDAVDARGHGGSRQQRNEFRLAAALRSTLPGCPVPAFFWLRRGSFWSR